MPNIDAKIVNLLIAKGYRYVRYDDGRVLQAAKAIKDSSEKMSWENVEVEVADAPPVIITMYTGQVIDLDSL